MLLTWHTRQNTLQIYHMYSSGIELIESVYKGKQTWNVTEIRGNKLSMTFKWTNLNFHCKFSQVATVCSFLLWQWATLAAYERHVRCPPRSGLISWHTGHFAESGRLLSGWLESRHCPSTPQLGAFNHPISRWAGLLIVESAKLLSKPGVTDKQPSKTFPSGTEKQWIKN